ncbi:DUF2868 domain-containing protein [Psychromonas arctica]|uniref:DUF2868 domain-containing protein n=1 Tax=Psychromonas arctica TaxID=168275 RepID=UPI0004222C6A|nr:DUF2868 domain-containing protein [Psychromonas arctica]
MDLYQNRLLTEGIRIIEKSSPSNRFNADYSTLNLSDALSKRTQLAELRYQASSVLRHLQQLLTFSIGLMCVFFLIVGASSVSQFLVNESSTQINFFWAIVLFIAPNILSLIIWCIVYFKRHALSLPWLANLILSMLTLVDKLQHKVSTKHIHYIDLFQFYFEHRFGAYMGRVQLSLISHLWWSSYLLGATLSLFLVLATHQVDFIWQTTILSEDTFFKLTQWLTYLPNLLAINVPTPSDVSHASIGIVNPLQVAQEIRISWSNLLIFSLIVYALLPRIILMLVFYQSIKQKKKNFQLDLSDAYYIQLKNILHPIGKASFISDADLHQGNANNHQNKESSQYNQSLVMPKNAYPIAIELNQRNLQQADKHVLKHYSVDLINVLDNISQQAALSALKSSAADHVILYVDVKRVPDRGWLSFAKKCQYKSNVQLYLLLLADQPVNKAKIASRLEDWIEIAAKVNISSQYITYLGQKMTPPNTHQELENG